MSKLSLLARNVLKYRVSVLYPSRQLTSRSFSSIEEEQAQPAEGEQVQPAEGEQVQPADGEQQEQQEPFADPLFRSSEDAVYAKLTGFGRNILKTDIIHFFEGSNLSTSDIKFEYNNAFIPTSMMLRFPSHSSFDTALRQTNRNGRLYRLDMIGSGKWDITESHDGRTVLVQGIPRNAIRDDIERFISGYNFDPTSFRFINRPGRPGTQNTAKALVFRVATGLQAMNFRIRKNRSLLNNTNVTVRVLE